MVWRHAPNTYEIWCGCVAQRFCPKLASDSCGLAVLFAGARDRQSNSFAKPLLEEAVRNAAPAAVSEIISDGIPETKCFLAGVCLCSSAGKKLHKFRNLVINAIKTTFPPGDEKRELLVDGCIFMYAYNDNAAPDPKTAVDNNDAVIMHVSHVSLSPFEPVFQFMDLISTELDMFQLQVVVFILRQRRPRRRRRRRRRR